MKCQICRTKRNAQKIAEFEDAVLCDHCFDHQKRKRREREEDKKYPKLKGVHSTADFLEHFDNCDALAKREQRCS